MLVQEAAFIIRQIFRLFGAAADFLDLLGLGCPLFQRHR
jgi:hypothetical protein